MNERIESTQNEKVKRWGKLHQKKYRDEAKQFLIEGVHLIQEALKAGCVEHLLLLEGINHPFKTERQVIWVTQEILNKLSQNVSEAQMIAVCRMPNNSVAWKEKGILLDGIQDPGNMGTILRTAVSFGYNFVVLSDNCVDVYNEKCIRSTQGALFEIAILRSSLLPVMDTLKQQGFTLLGTALKHSTPLKQIQRPDCFALVLGNEGQGISQEILQQCDQNILIEMDRFESLNVGVAAGICMYILK